MMCMILPFSFPFCTKRYGEKQQNTLLFWFNSKQDFIYHPSVYANILVTMNY